MPNVMLVVHERPVGQAPVLAVRPFTLAVLLGVGKKEGMKYLY